MTQNHIHYRGRDIAYREWGEGESVALLLHGFPSSSIDWEFVAPALSQKRRLLAPDFLGFGLSDKPRPHHYSLFEQADIIQAFAEDLKLTSVDLVCHDYGDTVGLELMTRLKEGTLNFDVRSVILLNGSIYFDLVELRTIQKLLEKPIIGDLIANFISRRVFGKQFGAIFSLSHPLPESEIDKHWELLTNNNGRAVYPLLIRYLSERRQHAPTRWEPTLENIGRPLCAIWGMVDPVAVGAMGERIKERCEDATVHLLEDVGHYPHIEVPDRVSELIVDFWDEVA